MRLACGESKPNTPLQIAQRPVIARVPLGLEPKEIPQSNESGLVDEHGTAHVPRLPERLLGVQCLEQRTEDQRLVSGEDSFRHIKSEAAVRSLVPPTI
jgi:hypothetical protein